MTFQVISPLDGQLLKEIPRWDDVQIENALQKSAEAAPRWAALPIVERKDYLRKLGALIRKRRSILATLITQEMGKLYRESLAEVDKCAGVCDYYADNTAAFLADEVIESDAGRSLVTYQPLGAILAVMPWNFPLWQVMRFAVPVLMAGNSALLKHASNVPQCALALQQLMVDAGLPEGVFTSLMIGAPQVKAVIEDQRVHAVSLTGSTPAGRQVAAVAGSALKKCVLELGGSDPFIVLADADIEQAVQAAVLSRYLNAGQSCIAAKRFIVVDAVAEQFVTQFKAAVEQLKVGDPMDETTSLAPLARVDLRDELHQQVLTSIAQGAIPLTGCQPVEGAGAFYQPSILDQVKPGMLAYSEELFGPVAIVIRAKDEQEAIAIANDSIFGLGGSIWTEDALHGERLARQIEAGAVFVNGMVKSDVRLPFGGVKQSGYGRELSLLGIREFVNAKTIWVR
ncbi:Succinate-semialdehyde dehydrogenase [NAD]; Succinate-semialdehyde dehydrogenase [NADP+] [hydrothermal vent metagenome]|uniref:Succinate-semialdehyde dehydrogenase [NAD] Succinate-semialdehyde dehydrogenase [NADP+] n=1 Tax=hydrothermal vent metagenome TaxID=652676 RepID=A0A3B0ZTG0_9ZZZZ